MARRGGALRGREGETELSHEVPDNLSSAGRECESFTLGRDTWTAWRSVVEHCVVAGGVAGLVEGTTAYCSC